MLYLEGVKMRNIYSQEKSSVIFHQKKTIFNLLVYFKFDRFHESMTLIKKELINPDVIWEYGNCKLSIGISDSHTRDE